MTAPSLSKVHNILLPGVTAARVAAIRSERQFERQRYAVYDKGEFVGCVVYVDNGETFGWRPADKPDFPLTSRVEAIQGMLR